MPSSARRPGDDGEPVEDGLGLVAGGVAGRVVAAGGVTLGERVAQVARQRLEVALAEQLDALDAPAAPPAARRGRGRSSSSASDSARSP